MYPLDMAGGIDQEIVIVGGSLSGLTFALACANLGIRTRVLERVTGQHRGGGALAIDRSLLLRVIGLGVANGGANLHFPPITAGRNAVSWQALHDWLHAQAHRHTEIEFMEGVTVLVVTQNDATATAVTSTGQLIDAPIIVGADGYQSVVRRAINPGEPAASYAGYTLWRGLVSETDLPSNTDWPRGTYGIALVTETGYRLVAYPVASKDGSLRPGERLISFAWYDPTRGALLRELGCLSDTGQVVRSLACEDIPHSSRAELRDQARKIWPDPWCTAILHAFSRREVFATPIAEYYPERLHRGRLGIIGDAAHVVSPVTGKGFIAGLLDAEALAHALKSVLDQPGSDLSLALPRYEAERLNAAQALASTSMAWSHAYMSQARPHAKKAENKT